MRIDANVTKNFRFVLDNKDSRILLLEGSSRCFHGGQLIVTSSGQKPISKVNRNDEVLSYNEKTCKPEYRRVLGVHQYSNNKPCLKIVLNNGNELICTEEHEFYYEGSWIPIKDLIKVPKVASKSANCINLDDIVSVEAVKLDTVYDIAVEGNSNYYLSNGEERILVHNSSKTYSTCQALIVRCLAEKLVVTIGRDNLTVCRRTVMEDVLEILNDWKVPHNRHISDNTIKLGKSKIRFIGLDDISKVHGLKQDIFYMNEGLTVKEPVYLQILQRTRMQLIVDYNPYKIKHFLYDWAEKRPDTKFLRTNIFDNPMAPPEVKKQILSYEPTPENIENGTANEFYWRVYGLGERYAGDDVVFRTRYRRYDRELDKYDWVYYGGDFGFTNPTALVKVAKSGDDLFLRVIMYETQHTNKEIAEYIHANSTIDKSIIQVWDSAEPKSIAELRQLNINAIKAIKGQHSIYFGVQKLLQYRLHLFNDVMTGVLAKEIDEARYLTDANGHIVLDAKGYPVLAGTDRHCLDAVRYVITKFQ